MGGVVGEGLGGAEGGAERIEGGGVEVCVVACEGVPGAGVVVCPAGSVRWDEDSVGWGDGKGRGTDIRFQKSRYWSMAASLSFS